MKMLFMLFFISMLQACASYMPVASSTLPSTSPTEVSNATRSNAGSADQKSKCGNLVLPAVNAIPVITGKQLAAINPADTAAMQVLLINHIERLHHYTVALKKSWQEAVKQHNKDCAKSQ